MLDTASCFLAGHIPMQKDIATRGGLTWPMRAGAATTNEYMVGTYCENRSGNGNEDVFSSAFVKLVRLGCGLGYKRLAVALT